MPENESYPAVCIQVDSTGRRYFQATDDAAPEWLRSGNHFVGQYYTSAKVGDRVTLRYQSTQSGHLWLPNK